MTGVQTCALPIWVLGQYRSTQRKVPTTPDDEAALVADIIELVRQFGRFGYRRITEQLKTAGWTVNHKRVERIWRREGLKVPSKQPKRGRLWLNDGSCIRLRAERPNHVWSYDFVADRTHDGKAYRIEVPPLKWSILRYGFSKEDHDGKKETYG